MDSCLSYYIVLEYSYWPKCEILVDPELSQKKPHSLEGLWGDGFLWVLLRR
jgi:hypothetical protein